MYRVKTTVHTEASAKSQETPHSQHTSRGELEATLALNVEGQSVDSVNIFGVLFVVSFISLCTLQIKVSVLCFQIEADETCRNRKIGEDGVENILTFRNVAL